MKKNYLLVANTVGIIPFGMKLRKVIQDPKVFNGYGLATQGNLILCSQITMTGVMLFRCPIITSIEWAIGEVKLELILFRSQRLKCDGRDGMHPLDVHIQGYLMWFDSHNRHAT